MSKGIDIGYNEFDIEINRKNITKIDLGCEFNIDHLKNLFKYEIPIIGNHVARTDWVYWADVGRNDSRVYASKDIQVQLNDFYTGTSFIYIGGNSDFQYYQLCNHVFSLIAERYPFANMYEVKSYIGGWIDESELKVKRAREVS